MLGQSIAPFSPASHGEPVPHHLSALIGTNTVAQKKYQLVFFLTAGLDNDVKMTLSLINVICRDH